MRKRLIARQKQNCYMISISTKIDGEIGIREKKVVLDPLAIIYKSDAGYFSTMCTLYLL